MRMKQKKENYTNENTLLDINVSDVFVVKNAKNRAFIEQFKYSSVNFTQRDLGTILGFFAVRDNASSSENIVNYLASEVKKQYFSPIQKPIEDKFESTLHHVNRVLEEIANVGNVEWIGHVDGAVCVIDDTSIHISVSGSAHVLLLRDNVLQDISEGLASEEAAQYPLKTFIDIASGELCAHDKIIITSQELLDLIPFEELQKNAIRFGQENFIQFIQTVLTNECAIASTTIIDISQKEGMQPHKIMSPAEVPKNLFGADAFEKKEVEEDTIPQIDEEINIEEILNEKPEEYTDEKTGHIYIQGGDEIIEDETKMSALKEKCSDFLYTCKKSTVKHKNTLSKKITQYTSKKNTPTSDQAPENIEEKMAPTKTIDTSHTYNIDEFDDVKEPVTNRQDTTPYNTPQRIKVTVYTAYKGGKDVAQSMIARCTNALQRIKNKHRNLSSKIKPNDTTINISTAQKKHSFLPSIHHVTQLWHGMSKQTKWTTLGILAAIVIIPLTFAFIPRSEEDTEKWPEIPEESEQYQQEPQPPEPAVPVTQNTISDPKSLLTDSTIVATTFMNDKHIGATKNTVTLFDGTEKEDYSLSSDAGDIALVTPMDDLNLLFILTTKDQLYTFSPADKKFVQQENIPTFDHTKMKSLGTYMTYLYAMDAAMITRYTRAENGFESGNNWLKEKADFSDATTMAIDEDIYTAKNGTITKYRKGEKVPFSQNADIKNAFIIYTTEDTKFMWVLDKENNKLFKTQKSTGEKLDEYIHEKFANTQTIFVDEKNNTATISTPDEILSFALTS